MKRIVCVVSIFALLAAGCASSTIISSIPPGAKVYIDGQYLGQAPVTQTDTALLGSSKTVILKKAGYQDRIGTIKKDDFKVGPLIGAIAFIIPILWITGYPEQYTFELEKIQ